MHVQSCCFVSLNLLLLIGRFRWRPLRRCLRSPFIPIQVFIWDKSNSFQQQLVMADSVFKACCSSAVWQCLWMVRWASLIFARLPYIRLTTKNYWLLCSELYPQHTNEPTVVSATPRNTEMICLQQCRKDVLKYKPPKNFCYFLINFKILGIAFIDIHIFVKKN